MSSGPYLVEFCRHSSQSDNAQSGGNTDSNHTNYHLTITDLSNAAIPSWHVTRRYREFRDLHEKMKLIYPDRIPTFPEKKLFGNQDPVFLNHRLKQLHAYMNEIMVLEPHCKSKILAEFLEIEKGTIHMDPSLKNASVTQTQTILVTNNGENVSNQNNDNSRNKLDYDNHKTTNSHTNTAADIRPGSNLNSILSDTNSKLIDLAQLPTNLEEEEIAKRKHIYQLAIQLHINTVPIDPIYITRDHHLESHKDKSDHNSSFACFWNRHGLKDGGEYEKWYSNLKKCNDIARESEIVVPFLD